MAALVIEPPQQPPAHRLQLTCDRHPDENFTGFCTSCLRERLHSLESPSTTHRNSTSTISASLKSIFFNNPTSSLILHPHLRRCKSFSCDVSGRNTLWSLFNQDDYTRVVALSGAHCLASDEIEVDGDVISAVDPVIAVETSGEIEETNDLRPMKDHVDLASQAKKPPPKDLKEIAGSLWLAVSVFMHKWRRKQKQKQKKMKKHEGDHKAVDAKSSTRFRETQSEIAVDALGRRSCDLDPRFSLDAGRISFDDGRYSFDEPWASWDGYWIGGGRSDFPRPPPIFSVVEDAPSPIVQRNDGEIPVEEDLALPGGSAQTKDYYSDSLSRSWRRSLDRSNSVKRVSVEVNEAKPVSNAKVSPAGSSEFFRDWSSNSLRDDQSESFESAFREDSSAHKLPPRNKSKRWSKAFSIWGFIHRRSGSRGGGNMVDRSFSEPWPELQANGCHANVRMLRSNSCTSSRSSIYGNGGFGNTRRNGVETNGIGKNRRDEFVLERNRSARYSPGHADNGMLRFYLTPMRGIRRGSGKGKHNRSCHSLARSVLQLY